MAYGEPPTTKEKIVVWIITILISLGVVCVVGGLFIGVPVYLHKLDHPNIPVPQVPKIKLVSMDFTLLNITETRLSAKWDLSIRIPYDLPDSYICVQGDLQASLLYKNVTLVTSSPQKYSNLRNNSPQVLKVSADVSDEDIGSLIGKDIIKDIKEKNEVKFGSQFALTDCRLETRGFMSFACDEATLRFQPGSDQKAGVFGDYPTCINF